MTRIPPTLGDDTVPLLHSPLTRLRSRALLSLTLMGWTLTGCAAHHLSVSPPASNRPWTPPPAAVTRDTMPKIGIPADLNDRLQRLTLPDLLDIALLNNPLTRASYATARAAGAGIGVARARFLPQLNANLPLEWQHSAGGNTIATGTTTTVSRDAGTNTYVVPNVSASWLLFDFGERGTLEAARQTAFAASFNHNATLQEVVLLVEQAYFNYNAAKSIRDAQLATVREDSTNLVAAQARHNAGVATIADVLQAQTLLSQAEVDLETYQGQVQTTRGSLATAIGVPPLASYDIQAEPPNVPIAGIAESVDTLVAQAVQTRPDLAALRAQARAAAANISAVRGAGLPSVSLGGSAGHTYGLGSSNGSDGNTWSAQLGVSVPIFQGFQTMYSVRQAKEQAKASAANADAQRDQVVNQVFTSYYTLQTATAHVRSSDVLLASAQASYNVARGRYQQGVGSILDLLTAESALASARSQQVQSRWTWYSSLAQLSHDVGVIGVHGESPIRTTAVSASDSTNAPMNMPSNVSPNAPPSVPANPAPSSPAPPSTPR